MWIIRWLCRGLKRGVFQMTGDLHRIRPHYPALRIPVLPPTVSALRQLSPFQCKVTLIESGRGPRRGKDMPIKLQEYVAGQIWLRGYRVKYLGMELYARMTVIRLEDDRLLLHSPCEIDDYTHSALTELGEVAYIVAPGTFHYLNIASAQAAFPEAETFLCPGIERKRSNMHFDWLLGDIAPAAWAGQLDQVLVRGNRWIWEVAFFHRQTRTLILVDLIEKFTDATPHVDWKLKLWWKIVFHMWNTAKPAAEYQLGWSDKKAARTSLQRILLWDFARVILAHGDLIEADSRSVVEKAWRKQLAE